MPHLFSRNALLLIACFVYAGSLSTWAQQTNPPRRIVTSPGPSSTTFTPPAASFWETPIASFDFPGGTVADFVKQLQPLATGVDRIAIERGSTFILPAFKERNTTLAGLIARVRWFASDHLDVTTGYDRNDDSVKTKLILSVNSFGEERRAPEMRYLADFDFKGGTANDLAEKIRAENLGWTNIYVNPEAFSQPIPSFKVQSITFDKLRDIIGALTQGRTRVAWTGTFLMIDSSPNALTAEHAATAILPLRELLKSYRIEDINALVQTALKMRDARSGKAEKEPGMSLHRETDTLIVVGSSSQVDLVQSVVNALAKQPFPKASDPQPIKETK